MKKTIALIVALTVCITAMLPMTFGATQTPTAVAEDMETTPTTTAVFCAATQVSYDNSPMQIGETRAVRVYHPKTGTAAGMEANEVSENIAIEYDENGDTLYITALAAGDAKLYVREKDCAFGAYVYVSVAEPLRGDVDQDGVLTSADARLTLQYVVGKVALLAIHSDVMFDYDGDGAITTADARDILIATL